MIKSWISLFSQLSAQDCVALVNLTFPPACPRTAKQNRVDSSVLPSILNCAKPAACPSMGWDTFLSTEYSCMAPTTRFCWRGEKAHKFEQSPKSSGIYSHINLFCFISLNSAPTLKLNLWHLIQVYLYTPDTGAFLYYTSWPVKLHASN